VIALEPEAASIYIRQLRMSQLVPQHPGPVGRRSVLASSSSGMGVVGVNSAGLNAVSQESNPPGTGGEERVSDSFIPG